MLYFLAYILGCVVSGYIFIHWYRGNIAPSDVDSIDVVAFIFFTSMSWVFVFIILCIEYLPKLICKLVAKTHLVTLITKLLRGY